MTLPDYSAWLTPERLVHEESLWADPAQRTWPIFVDWINRLAADDSVCSIIEYGCGTGWVPANISPKLHYVGIDANPDCLLRAMRRNPTRLFSLADVRIEQPLTFDVACAFSFLKHFGLHEWDAIVAKVLRRGRYGLFSMPVGDRNEDTGTEFPHVWVTEEHLREAIHAAEHELLQMEPLPTGEQMVTTLRW